MNNQQRIVSGMRPTGHLHLGHYHGVLKNWVRLQREYECFFFVADWHALTTQYKDPASISEHVWDMVVDWLAVGVSPQHAHLFVQSHVPEHAEFHLLLSMITPLSWLKRVPSYKGQQEELKHLALDTYGFLGYPLLQSADILIYKAAFVPVGEDQVAHVELTREVARRFNDIYGKDPDFAEKALLAIKKLGKKQAKLYQGLRKAYQEKGDMEALEKGRMMVVEHKSITLSDQERLVGYLEGGGKSILLEPQEMVTEASKLVGVDGRKMSKSYGNTIALREAADSIAKKIRTMPTDTARVRRNDPGDPEKCPVWNFHKIYSDESRQQDIKQGCTSASIGCLDCKQFIIDDVIRETTGFRESAQQYLENPALIRNIIAEGTEVARDEAKKNLAEVKELMGIMHHRKRKRTA